MVVLSCDSVQVSYGAKQILFDVSLDIPQKEIIAFIGPSGCGKSTLLRCFNRMNDVISSATIKGEITFQGNDIYDPTLDIVSLRKKIGMVFQKPNPFPLSIFENVAYGLRVQGVSKEKRKKIVIDSLKKADLWDEVKDKLDASAFDLSGGQQQRLCIARALAIDPEVLLLDEPCSALDPISTAMIEKLLLKLKKEKTILIVTHNMSQAKRISDKTCFMLLGEVIEYDATENIFAHPKDSRTRDYIGGKFG
ncbi:MAG: phosphate ABC transporter ATP-binding protein [Nanoarchaeota archaeon]|nr:phosphate ABC transporter ATP-binding protein [Nanoarchaeota archaeon]